ncbi:hypothetical protein T03_9633 [Trichinella britovi]|uniref:Uncharacterized protein n=1 Tax=Trichinella britovi TaxID=45882 RepID=A0A0V0YZN4_TRIBR|nr:hypothetical protein T03_9633 [Trichinella britovi]
MELNIDSNDPLEYFDDFILKIRRIIKMNANVTA